MPQTSKVELYAAIRRDHRDGMTMREITRKYNVSWRTIGKAVDSVWPEPRKKLPPRATTLDPYKAVVDGILRADMDAPRKQRHTVTRNFHRLVEEHGAEVFYQQVRRYVADRLTFNGTNIETGTDSYRLASTRTRAEEPTKAG